MASEEHLSLTQFLKEVHASLRKSSFNVGAQQAWQRHCENKDVLKKYALCMEQLAAVWDRASGSVSPVDGSAQPASRIMWTANLCCEYFLDNGHKYCREKEVLIATKIGATLDVKESFSAPLKVLDVGSCYNPFKVFEFLDVLPIDLWPANSSVFECDFLAVPVGSSTDIEGQKLKQLEINAFDALTFCFLLEYIPTSELRLEACKKAYILLKPAGLLIINTPDSKHVSANCKIMKCWQYTLANLGFIRIRYEKLRHMHCMAFRKAIIKDVAVRWALIHKKPYMDDLIQIPQDIQEKEERLLKERMEFYQALPFFNVSE